MENKYKFKYDADYFSASVAHLKQDKDFLKGFSKLMKDLAKR